MSTKLRLAFIALVVSLLAACAPAPKRAGIPTEWKPSPNFGERQPNFVIIHHTSDDTAAEGLRTLTDPASKVSAHYLIARDGTTYQLLDERARGWHAGASYWGGSTDLNSSSLGIELDNNGDEPFAKEQIEALLALLGDIMQRYEIPQANFLGHADIAPRRKVDPSRYFPWGTLAKHGFGLWCEPPFAPTPVIPDPVTALQALGYDVSDFEAAIRAFKRHFAQNDSVLDLTEEDLGRLHCLIERKRSQS